MSNVAPKILANDNMPRRAIPLIELLLDLRRNVLLDVVLVKCGGSDVDGFLLHLLRHVDVLDYGFGQAFLAWREACGGGLGVSLLGHFSKDVVELELGGSWKRMRIWEVVVGDGRREDDEGQSSI